MNVEQCAPEDLESPRWKDEESTPEVNVESLPGTNFESLPGTNFESTPDESPVSDLKMWKKNLIEGTKFVDRRTPSNKINEDYEFESIEEQDEGSESQISRFG